MENIGFGASSLVFKTKKSTVLKHPVPGYEAELDFERRAYEWLGHHPRIATYLRQVGLALELEYYQRGCIDQARRLITKSELPYLKWTEQIAEGLAFVHSKGVIHCDLRSPNILVTDAEDVVLADFASCVMNGVKMSNVSNKTRYRLPGSDQPGYQVTVQDDLFAFGTLVYNLITGKVPYEEQTDEEVIKLYTSGIFPDLSGLPMSGLIDRCWRGGYSSATQVLKDIR
jgi:serine/threonine protein kinase